MQRATARRAHHRTRHTPKRKRADPRPANRRHQQEGKDQNLRVHLQDGSRGAPVKSHSLDFAAAMRALFQMRPSTFSISLFSDGISGTHTRKGTSVLLAHAQKSKYSTPPFTLPAAGGTYPRARLVPCPAEVQVQPSGDSGGAQRPCRPAPPADEQTQGLTGNVFLVGTPSQLEDITLRALRFSRRSIRSPVKIHATPEAADHYDIHRPWSAITSTTK